MFVAPDVSDIIEDDSRIKIVIEALIAYNLNNFQIDTTKNNN